MDFSVFQWSFNVGTLIAVIFVAGGFYRSTINTLKEIKEDLGVLNTAIAQLAVQNTRLDNQAAMIAATQKAQSILEQRLYDLSQGRGFMQHRIDGEWPQRNPVMSIPQD